MPDPPEIGTQDSGDENGKGAVLTVEHAGWATPRPILPYQRSPDPYAERVAERDAARAEVARLRAGIAGLRIAHYEDRSEGLASCPAFDGYGSCICGADEHNRRIDTLLTESEAEDG